MSHGAAQNWATLGLRWARAVGGGKSSRYRHAARHLAECRANAGMIEDFAGFPTHAEFMAGLKLRHGRKYAFWSIVEG